MAQAQMNPKNPEIFFGVVLGIDTALDKLWGSKPTFLKIRDTLVSLFGKARGSEEKKKRVFKAVPSLRADATHILKIVAADFSYAL